MSALDGKAVVITGSGRGIGAAYALHAGEQGASVVVNDIDGDAVDDVVEQVRSAGGRVIGKVADVATWDGAAALIEACVDAFGRIDGLVNNAGLFAMNRLEEIDEAEVRSLVDANVVGTAFCGTQAARRMLGQRSGSIVNVTSGAHTGIPMMGVYGATKGAVASFTYTWAAELAGTGVRCNAISPMGKTRMVETTAQYLASKGIEMYEGQTPDPAVNAPVATYLLSDRSANVNGQIVRIEGGQLAIMTHPAVWVPVLQRDVWTFDAVCDAFDSDLAGRQSPTGVVGIEPRLTSLASTFWDASASLDATA